MTRLSTRLVCLVAAVGTMLAIISPVVTARESSRLSEPGLAAIQSLLAQSVAEGRIPGAVAMVARDGEMLWMATSGE